MAGAMGKLGLMNIQVEDGEKHTPDEPHTRLIKEGGRGELGPEETQRGLFSSPPVTQPPDISSQGGAGVHFERDLNALLLRAIDMG